jgi:hypothetical protein
VKIRPVGADLFNADRRTGRHEEANSRIFAILRETPKKISRSQYRSNLRIYARKCEYSEKTVFYSTQAIHID